MQAFNARCRHRRMGDVQLAQRRTVAASAGSARQGLPVREKNREAPLITLRNVVSESATLHHTEASRGSVFQAIGQFNHLQFATPHHMPENGITGYAMDHTQGPSCAMTHPAPPGTRYWCNV
jgi:hypothetical protein